MNNHFQKIALRFAAVTGLLVAGTGVGCSSTNEPVQPGPTPPTAGGTAPSTAGSPSTGGGGSSSTAGSGGTATAGTGGGNGCPQGQQMLPMGAGCGCPAFNPNYCEPAGANPGKCVNFTKNADHCGACGMACGATSACVASACTPELPTVAELAGCGKLFLVYANTTLYALNMMAGELVSVPATGAPVSIATGLTGATAFAVDATSAYVVNGTATAAKVTKVTLVGGTKLDLVTETLPIYDVTVDATSIYYAVDKPDTAVPAVYAGVIKKASNSAATAAPEVVGLGMDNGQPKGVVVSGMNILYATDSSKNVEVQKGLPVGADPHTDTLHYKLGASQGSLVFGHRSIQTDGTYVYWLQDSVQRSKFADAAPVQAQVAASIGISASFALSPAAPGTPPTMAYFGSDMGDFSKAAIPSDMSTQLARKLETITSIVVDATNVYVASGCKILKAPL